MKQEKIRGAMIRMCAGCGARHKQDEMIRVVKSKDGRVTVDPQNGEEGRSAYLCRDEKCLARLKKNGRLASLLRTADIDQTVYERLEETIDR